MNLRIRPADPEDLNFIFSTWLRSMKHDSPMTMVIPRDTFFVNHQRLIERLLTRPQVRTLVCCDSEDPRCIFGYLVEELPATLHWAYVKKAFRRQGVFRRLLEEGGLAPDLAGCEYTQFTNSMMQLWKAEKLRGLFNPYLLEETERGKD